MLERGLQLPADGVFWCLKHVGVKGGVSCISAFFIYIYKQDILASTGRDTQFLPHPDSPMPSASALHVTSRAALDGTLQPRAPSISLPPLGKEGQRKSSFWGRLCTLNCYSVLGPEGEKRLTWQVMEMETRSQVCLMRSKTPHNLLI